MNSIILVYVSDLFNGFAHKENVIIVVPSNFSHEDQSIFDHISAV